LPLKCTEKRFFHFSADRRRVQGPMINFLIALHPSPAGLYRLPARIDAAGLIDRNCRPWTKRRNGCRKRRLRSAHGLHSLVAPGIYYCLGLRALRKADMADGIQAAVRLATNHRKA